MDKRRGYKHQLSACSHEFAFRLRDFCAFESAGKALNRVHYIFIDIQTSSTPTDRLALRIHAWRISKLAASLQKRISRRIITEDRFSLHKRPSSTFAQFRGIFRNPIYRHSSGLWAYFISVLPDNGWEKEVFRTWWDRASIRRIVEELAILGFIRWKTWLLVCKKKRLDNKIKTL